MNDNDREKLSQTVQNLAMTVDLKIDPDYRVGVEENFAKLTEISKLVMDFPLDSHVEAAPKFEP